MEPRLPHLQEACSAIPQLGFKPAPHISSSSRPMIMQEMKAPFQTRLARVSFRLSNVTPVRLTPFPASSCRVSPIRTDAPRECRPIEVASGSSNVFNAVPAQEAPVIINHLEMKLLDRRKVFLGVKNRYCPCIGRSKSARRSACNGFF